MKKKLLLATCIIFAAMFSTGESCTEYGLLNSTVNVILTVVGLVGMLFTGFIFCTKFCKG